MVLLWYPQCYSEVTIFRRASMSATKPRLTRYQVAAIQYESTPGAREQNTGDLFRLVEEAAQHEARLIVFLEMQQLATVGNRVRKSRPMSSQFPARLQTVSNNLPRTMVA